MLLPRHQNGAVQSQRRDQNIGKIVLQIDGQKAHHGVDFAALKLLFQFPRVALHENNIHLEFPGHFHAEVHGKSEQTVAAFVQKGKRRGMRRHADDEPPRSVSLTGGSAPQKRRHKPQHQNSDKCKERTTHGKTPRHDKTPCALLPQGKKACGFSHTRLFSVRKSSRIRLQKIKIPLI